MIGSSTAIILVLCPLVLSIPIRCFTARCVDYSGKAEPCDRTVYDFLLNVAGGTLHFHSLQMSLHTTDTLIEIMVLHVLPWIYAATCTHMYFSGCLPISSSILGHHHVHLVSVSTWSLPSISPSLCPGQLWETTCF
jgi:hypothetical protein